MAKTKDIMNKQVTFEDRAEYERVCKALHAAHQIMYSVENIFYKEVKPSTFKNAAQRAKEKVNDICGVEDPIDFVKHQVLILEQFCQDMGIPGYEFS